jgi:hypothetical protein
MTGAAEQVPLARLVAGIFEGPGGPSRKNDRTTFSSRGSGARIGLYRRAASPGRVAGTIVRRTLDMMPGRLGSRRRCDASRTAGALGAHLPIADAGW